MTKVIILGQEPKQKKNLKPIEFTESINSYKTFDKGCVQPNFWMNVELIYKQGNFDVMFAYDEDRNKGCLYLGYFNDGVVE